VGTTIYNVTEDREWRRQETWEERISRDWAGKTHAELKALLHDIRLLRLQEPSKQNRHKLSYYVPLQANREALTRVITDRMTDIGVRSNLIWSLDEPQGVGLLDILPAGASKYYAIEALMQQLGFGYHNTVFCGDSGNDIEVMASAVPAVLVANADGGVKQLAQELAQRAGFADRLYIAQGGFYGMNGNYSGGMLEGIAHYHPESIPLMGLESA
jgi:HAD superfamily hydrolase (TIGR01484 family)